MATDLVRTARHWDESHARFSGAKSGLFWWEVPGVQEHINARISGDPTVGWLEYTVESHFADRLPLDKCLSLGCGVGHLERTLARLGAFRQCDAYDISDASITLARKAAKEQGFHSIDYQVADANRLILPITTYDAIWINGAMHHFRELEYISQQLSRSLKPGGLLVLNEYVGPARFQFPERQKQLVNLCLQLLPARYRTLVDQAVELELERNPLNKGLLWFFSRVVDKAREGDLLGVIQRRLRAYRAQKSGTSVQRSAAPFPSCSSVVTTDPSEAVRSDEIVPILRKDWQIVERRDWGGNISQFLFSGIAGNFAREDPCSQRLVEMLLEIEDVLLECGEFQSDFAYIAARPRQALIQPEAGSFG
jgi:SAM-dependent methyltransferase